MDIILLRNALLITLSITLVLVLYRRFRLAVLARHMPAPMHAELVELLVEYHPARLRVTVKVPSQQILSMRLLDADHQGVHEWPAERQWPGEVELMRDLPVLPDGLYHLELSTATQRTERMFRLQQA
jgi:hypothetical protein